MKTLSFVLTPYYLSNNQKYSKCFQCVEGAH